MTTHSSVLAILASAEAEPFAHQVATSLGYPQANVIIGTPMSGATYLQQQPLPIRYIIIDIGQRSHDVLPEIDALAEQCNADTRVVVLGHANDISLYRQLLARGIIEYYNHPANVAIVRDALTAADTAAAADTRSTVVTFMSAASGDGASTVALNTAYCLATMYNKSTVIIDMDFQFGMVARNLDLSTPFGIKELFEHPDRSVDNTLIDRMLVDYCDNLKIMAAPNDLRLWPTITPEAIRELIITLRSRFEYVIIDLPHIWSSWLATALTGADKNIIVAQLWLRSVTHTARLLGAWRDICIDEQSIVSIINRSGAKFKEAVTAKDYESVCRKTIDFYIANDIKTIVAAENEGRTIPEIGNSTLSRQFRELAGNLTGDMSLQPLTDPINQTSTKSGLSSLTSVFAKK